MNQQPVKHLGHRLVCLRTVAQVLLIVEWGGATSGCGQRAGCGWSRNAERTGRKVATVGSHEVSTADLYLHLASQSERARLGYQDRSARRAFVDEVVRFELLAAEAERRGYARDSEVVRGMKQQMISRMVQDEMAKHDEAAISEAEVARYFEEHRVEFIKPAAASIREIVVKDRTVAEAIANEARSLRRPDFFADQKAFEKLAARHASSPDAPAVKQSVFFEESSSPFPTEVTKAIFTMTELGEVLGPVESEQAYYIIKLAGWRPAVTRSMTEVQEQIRQQLLAVRRNQLVEGFVADLRKNAAVQVDEAALDQVNWNLPSTTPSGMR